MWQRLRGRPGALHGQCLEGRGECAEAYSQNSAGEKEGEGAVCLAEEDESQSEEAKARIHGIVRSVVIEEVADKRSCHDDDDRKDDEEKAWYDSTRKTE